MSWVERWKREREQQRALERQREAAVYRRLRPSGRTLDEVHTACVLAAAITPGSSKNVTLAALRRLRDRGEVHERDGVWYPGLGPTPPQGSRVGAPAPGGGERASSPAPGATAGPSPSAATSHPPAPPSDDPRPTAPDQDGSGHAGTDQAEDLAGGSSPPAEVVTGHGVETARPPSAQPTSVSAEGPVSLADRVVAAVRARPGRSCTAVADEVGAWPAQVAKVSRTDPRIRRVARPRSNAWDLHPAELPPPSLLSSSPSPQAPPGKSIAASGGDLPTSSSPSPETSPATNSADAGGSGMAPARASGDDLVDDTPLAPAGVPAEPAEDLGPVSVSVPDPCPVPPPGRSVDIEDQVGALLGLEEGASDEELVEAVAELRKEREDWRRRAEALADEVEGLKAGRDRASVALAVGVEYADQLREALGLIGHDGWSFLLQHVRRVSDDCAAAERERDALRLERDTARRGLDDALTEAADKIARICGCPTWDYPGQLVRDVRALADERDALRLERDTARRGLDEQAEALTELRKELQEAHARSDRHFVRVGELEAQVRTLQLELDAASARAAQAEAAAESRLQWGSTLAAVLHAIGQELRVPSNTLMWSDGVLAGQEAALEAWQTAALDRIRVAWDTRKALRFALTEMADDRTSVGSEASVKAAVLRIREPLEAALGAPARVLTLASLADEAERAIAELRLRADQRNPAADEVALELLLELRDRAEASGLRVPRRTDPAVLIAYLTGWLEAAGVITAPVPPRATVSVLDDAPVSAGA